MRNEAKHGPAITPGSIQSIKGNVAKDNTQTKLRSDSANVTYRPQND